MSRIGKPHIAHRDIQWCAQCQGCMGKVTNNWHIIHNVDCSSVGQLNPILITQSNWPVKNNQQLNNNYWNISLGPQSKSKLFPVLNTKINWVSVIAFKRLTPASFPICAYLTPPRTRSSTLEFGSLPGSSTWIKSCQVNNCPGPLSRTLIYIFCTSQSKCLSSFQWTTVLKRMCVCVNVFNPS